MESSFSLIDHYLIGIFKVFEKEKIHVLIGRYGAYIKQGRKNFKIPKGTEPKSLTREDCISLWKNQPANKPRGKKKK